MRTGTGGMRFGAGRRGWHLKAEHCRQIDTRRARERILQTDCSGAWAWTDPTTGEQLACFGYRSDRLTLSLTYNMDRQPMRQHVPILTTACNYGGRRFWFGCPKCGRRVAVLYLRNPGFGCRSCCRIAYASQSEDAVGRTWRKQSKVERRLDENWSRPKAMHQAIYEMPMAAVWDCEERRNAALAVLLERLGWPGSRRIRFHQLEHVPYQSGQSAKPPAAFSYPRGSP